MVGYIQIMTAAPDRRNAEVIADALVGRRLAGCVQIVGPVKSVFRWKRRVERKGEWICIIKTSRKNYKRVETEIKKVHKYSVPEIISFPISRGNSAYIKWLGENVR